MRSPFSPGAFGRIAAYSMIGIAGVWVAYDLVGAARWFAEDYRRLWRVGLAVIVGAPLLLTFLMLPASWKQRIGSCFWGIAACTVTGYAAYFLYACWRLREALAVGGGWWLMVVVVLMVWGCAAWLWWVVWEKIHARPTA